MHSRWNCLVSILTCVSVAVLVIVAGQSTTGDDMSDPSLSTTVDSLRRELVRLAAEHARSEAKLASRIAQLENRLNQSPNEPVTINEAAGNGASYHRWGRKTCEGNASLVYKGHSAGPHHSRGGGGSNFLCLPEDPQWNTFINGDQTGGSVAGVEYELYNSNNVFSERNTDGNLLWNNPAPCSVCYVGRSTVLMIPAKTQCPDGWTTEYSGYLMSEYSAPRSTFHSTLYRHRSSYICWDEAPEVAVGGTSQHHAVIYPVEAICGSLPCSVYPTGRELTCVVCSK